jgi:2-methylcitrate dehydratase PrpD
MTTVASQPGATAQLAAYIAGIRPNDLPGLVAKEALRSFVNIFGCTLGGARHESVEIVWKTLAPFQGKEAVTLIGRGARSDALTACLVNGLASSAHTFDDTHAEAIIHPSGPVMAAALAVAEMQPVTGAELLTAFALGVEVNCRISKAVSVAPAKGDIAWSQTGIVAGIGAAVAAAKLMGFDAKRTAQAIGHAAAFGAGIRVAHGTMCMPFMPAHAGQMGLRAALLTKHGFTASDVTLEGNNGFFATFAKEGHLDHAIGELGTRFEILGNTYKPYPCGIVIHPIIDACLALKAAHKLDPAAIARVDIAANPTAMALCYRRHPETSLLAQVSLYHWAAAAFVHGAGRIDEGSETAIREPAIVALRDRIEVVTDANVAPDAAHVTVTLKDGTVYKHAITHGIGSRSNPMTDAQLSAKFRDLAGIVLPEKQIEPVLEMCWDLPALKDAEVLVRAAA